MLHSERQWEGDLASDTFVSAGKRQLLGTVITTRGGESL